MSPRPKPPTTRLARGEPDTGTLGERLAAGHLRGLGFRIEATRLRTVHGEIDLLVRRRAHWVAVEVKCRRGHGAPEHTIGPVQLDRIGRAARSLLPHLRPRPRSLRVDAVAVCLRPDGSAEVRHFPGLRELDVDPP
jgi:putative endonuclease